jgi:hypothetical protein
MDDFLENSLQPDLATGFTRHRMKILRKAGPLQTVGGGTIWHAVEEGVAVVGGPALCRDRPAWRGHRIPAMRSHALGVAIG